MPPKKNLTSTSNKSSSHSTHRGVSFSDLVTKSEAALSSQATIYSQKTQINSQYGSLDNEYQFNRQDAGQIFISKQQQNVIQQILQISRKGKINQNNAFDIPLKVMNTEGSQNNNAKFWKFASQLLNASMVIYDKRVQNVYINTHKMCNKINRINGNNNQVDNQKQDDAVNYEDRVRNAQNNKRTQLLNIRIQDYSSLKQVDSLNVGISTLEEKEKLNIKKIQNQFIADPTFLNTQKKFDSYSLNSLMLNHYNQWYKYESQLFGKSYEQPIPQQIMQKHPKLEFIAKNQTLFQQINSFLQKTPQLNGQLKADRYQTLQNQHSRQQLNQFKNLFQEIAQHFECGFQSSKLFNCQLNQIHQIDQQSVQSSPFHFISQDTTALNITNPIEIKSSWSQRVDNMFHSQGHNSQDSYFLLSQQNDYNTMMTPWQLQFKGQKLMKKKKRQNQKIKQSRTKSQKQKLSEFTINFFDNITEKRSNLKLLSTSQINKILTHNAKANKEDINLTPMNYDVYAIYHKKIKTNFNKLHHHIENQPYFAKDSQNLNFQNMPQSFPFDLDHNHSRIQDIKIVPQLQNNQNNQKIQRFSEGFNPQTQSLGLTTYFGSGTLIGIHNMRQIKKIIFDQLKKRGSLKMSEIQINLSPAQILISCLHIVNQNNLQIISLDDQEDYILKFPHKNENHELQI